MKNSVIFLSQYRTIESDHKVYLVVSSKEAIKDANADPDFFFQQRVPDYHCSCQMGKRRQGTCVHIQVALFAAKLTVAEKRRYKKAQSILKKENYMQKFEEEDNGDCEEYLEGAIYSK